MRSSIAALVLAAGQGKRMQSTLPKVLHPCYEWPLLCHPVSQALQLGCSQVVVVCAPTTQQAIAQQLGRSFPGQPLSYGVQAEAKGTGDAARVGLASLAGQCERVLILYGDTPLLSGEALRPLLAATAGPQAPPAAFLTAHVAQPRGYGRVLRDRGGAVLGIVEDRDASDAQAKIDEVNAGVYCFAGDRLAGWLQQLGQNNAQGELYLTDCIGQAVAAGGAVGLAAADPDDIRGVNSRSELQLAADILRLRAARRHQAAGVSVADVAGSFIGPQVSCGRDVELGMGVQLRGRCRLGDGVRIEGPAVLIDSELGAGAQVRAFSHLEGAQVAAGAQVGPMARLRPGAQLGAGAKVGNFVEVKAAQLGAGAKVGHLSYIGDASVGAHVNVGAGTITCNYDGFAKHRTQIGADTFVGSHSTLVAPLSIGSGAFIAAGSTITDDVAEGGLAFGRARQTTYAEGGRALRLRLENAAAGREKDKR